MKTARLLRFTPAVLCAALLGVVPVSHAQPGSTAGASASGAGVVERVEGAVVRGAQAAASGVERGVDAAKRGVKKGVEAAASGVQRGAKATAEAADHVARKVGGASSPAASSSGK